MREGVRRRRSWESYAEPPLLVVRDGQIIHEVDSWLKRVSVWIYAECEYEVGGREPALLETRGGGKCLLRTVLRSRDRYVAF